MVYLLKIDIVTLCTSIGISIVYWYHRYQYWVLILAGPNNIVYWVACLVSFLTLDLIYCCCCCRTISALMLDQNYINLKNQVIKAERRVLKELGFCVHVKHPHKVFYALLFTWDILIYDLLPVSNFWGGRQDLD